MVAMVGIAAVVSTSTQQDLAVSGQDREGKMAFYAAEFAVASAKDFLAGTAYDPNAGWGPFLASGVAQLCQPGDGTKPGVAPKTAFARKTLYTIGAGNVEYNWCLHNNADDPGYMFPPLGTPNGDTTDEEPQHLLTIEAYGWAPNGASSRLSVTLGAPSRTTTGSSTCYAQEGGCSGHAGNGGAAEANIAIDTSATKSF